MPGPTGTTDTSIPVTVTADPAKILESANANQYATQVMEKYFDVVGKSSHYLDELNSKLEAVGINMQNSQHLTTEQVASFGLLSVAVAGTHKSFTDLAGVDTKSLSTFTGQIESMVAASKNSGSAIKALSDMSMNVFGRVVPDSIKTSLKSVKDFVMNVAESADNGVRLQNAYVQMAAKTGDLGNVFKAAGVDLGNMNALLSKQQEVLSGAAEATGVLPEQIHKYYAELGTVPHALESVVTGTKTGNQSINMLTATIKLATGTGRNYSEVVEDLHQAFKTYGTTGEDALKFTARMSELSNKFGVELGDVRQSLRATADTFKMFGNEAEGAAKIMNSYLGALQSTGLSGSSSVTVIGEMTGKLKELSIAQKAFLSAQTGGPGGLMGGFQIEKLMNEGKIDEVFEKVRMQMQKQFGKIVSVEEASNSPEAAAQLVKQRAILKQGPLGNFAKDDQTASKILEAFRAKDEGRSVTTPLSDTILKEGMDRGTQIQEMSFTELSKIRAILASQQGQANIANKGTVEEAAAARSGIQNNTAKENVRYIDKDNLRQHMDTSSVRSGRAATDVKNTIATGKVVDTSRTVIKTDLKNVLGVFSEIGSVATNIAKAAKNRVIVEKETEKFAPTKVEPPKNKSMVDGITNMFSDLRNNYSKIASAKVNENGIPSETNKPEIVLPENKNLNNVVVTKEQNPIISNTAIPSETKQVTREVKIQPNVEKESKDNNESFSSKITGMLQNYLSNNNENNIQSPSKQVRQAVTNNGIPVAAAAAEEVANNTSKEASVRSNALTERNQKVQIEVTGYCLKCKNEIAGSRQASSTNVASTGE